MNPLFRIPVAAFLMDCALYFALTGVPYKALSLDTSVWGMGVLPAAYSFTYAVLALNVWRFTKSHHRLAQAKVLLPVAAVALLSLSLATHWLGLFFPLSVLGFCLAFYWPPLQAFLADMSPKDRLSKNLGTFNVAWSSGKGVGFLLGGLVLHHFGFSTLFLLAAGLAMVVWVLILPLRNHTQDTHTKPQAEVPLHPRHHVFLVCAWIANTLSFGSIAVLNYHYPKHLMTLGLSESVFGLCLGTILLTQTAVFVALRHHLGWRYRIWVLLGAQGLVLSMLFLLTQVTTTLGVVVLAPLLGVGIGVSYFSSVSYSVEDQEHRGRNAGIHEGALALGAVALPILGAGFSRSTQGPMIATSIVLGVGIFIQAVILIFLRKPSATKAV